MDVKLRSLLFAFLCIAITGCGGGGSSEQSPVTKTPVVDPVDAEPTPEPKPTPEPAPTPEPEPEPAPEPTQLELETSNYVIYTGSYLTRQLEAASHSGDTLSFALEETATNGDLQLSETGLFTYRPSGAFSGSDSFSVRIDAGGGWSDPVQVNLQSIAPGPQALLDVEVELTERNEATLKWSAFYGTSTLGYDVRYAHEEITLDNWHAATRVTGEIEISTLGETIRLKISGLDDDQDYYFGLRLENVDGPADELSNIVYVKTAPPPQISLDDNLPTVVTIERNQSIERTFEIHNNGDSDLNFQIVPASSANVAAASLDAPHKATAISKGEKDTRKGEPITQGSGGPDTFGYRWTDSNEPGGPAYSWVEIGESGTIINGLVDDNVTGPIPIGFDFPFYGAFYSETYIGSNGFISFSPATGNGCCSGQPLPSQDDVSNIIAWFWQDLDPRSGQVFYQSMDDGRFVIQFEEINRYGSDSAATAQVILHQDGTILLQYQALTHDLANTHYTVGLENADATDGLQIVFNTSYLEDRLAIRISAEPEWLSLSPRTGSIPLGESETVTIRYEPKVAAGSYSTQLLLNHDDPSKDTFVIPLEMSVVPDVTPPGTIGDLRAADITADQVTLRWSAVADQGFVKGSPVKALDLRYSTTELTEANWQNATPVEDPVLPLQPGADQLVDISGLQSETTYHFGVKAIDASGNTSALSNVITATTLPPPTAATDITSVDIELREGRTALASLILSNSGGSNLDFTAAIVEQETAGTVYAARQAQATSPRAVKTLTSMPAEGTHVPNQVIVRFKRQADASVLHAIQQQYQAKLVKRIPALQMEVWQLPEASSTLQAIQGLNQNSTVIFAEPNYKLSLQNLPNDSSFGDLWGLHNTGALGGTVDADIDAVEAWEYSTGSRDVIVAVVDTGIDYTHPDLANNIWINENEIPDNGFDDDGNGFIDDVYGFHFYSDTGDPQDGNGHGTHVAGTIGAVGNNLEGVVGVNHQVRLMAVPFLSSSGSGSADDAIEAIVYAVDNGADILNNSWGGSGYSEAVATAIEYAHAQGVLFVAAAGNWSLDNDIDPTYPANYPVANIISVAATDRNDQLATFSNYGATSVHLAAPGVDTLSTVPNNGYESFSGTSMATPHVAGAAALLKAYRPNLTHLELKSLLLDSADRLDNLTGVVSTGARLNVNEAMLLSGPSWVALVGNLTGSIAPGSSLEISLELTALGLDAGEHTVDLQIRTNDPSQPVVTIPITLTVLPDTEPPATISDLTVSEVTDTHAVISFTAPGDDGTEGQTSSYDLRFATEPVTDGNWSQAQSLEYSAAPAEGGSPEQFSVSGLPANTELWLAVRAVDNMGLESGLSNVVHISTLNAELEVTPDPVPDIVLSTGGSTNVELSLQNIGDVDVSASVDTGGGGSFGAYAVQYFSQEEIAKGEVDTRKGAPVTSGTGGPDDFGYMWIDSDEVDGPTYQWEDISSTGTLVTGLYDDSISGPIAIGFEFPFYGESQTEVHISSNGFIAFSPTGNGCCAGNPIPRADSVNNMIAWLWYDLHPGFGQVHYRTLDGSRLIIQFTDYGEWSGSGTVDAQAILHASGAVELRYRAFEKGMQASNASIGIENANGTAGLQVAFNTDYLKNEHAILFRPHWLMTSEAEVTLAPGESARVLLEVDTRTLSPGEYQSQVRIRSNDTDQPELILPVNLQVTE